MGQLLLMLVIAKSCLPPIKIRVCGRVATIWKGWQPAHVIESDETVLS